MADKTPREVGTNDLLLHHPFRLVVHVATAISAWPLQDRDLRHMGKVGIRRGAAASPSPNAPFQTVQDTFASYGFPTDHPEELQVRLFFVILDE
jgi:hypothetical protein